MTALRSNSRFWSLRGTESFSIFLGLVYLAIFHLWILCSPVQVRLSGILVTGVLLPIFYGAWKRGYFLNRWDAVFHLCVILDIFLEGILLPIHDDFGFYWCALGFAVFIVAYRFYVRFKRSAAVKNFSEP